MKRIFRTNNPGLSGYASLALFVAGYLLLAGLVLAPQALLAPLQAGPVHAGD